jgi:hypothetical protein
MEITDIIEGYDFLKLKRLPPEHKHYNSISGDEGEESEPVERMNSLVAAIENISTLRDDLTSKAEQLLSGEYILKCVNEKETFGSIEQFLNSPEFKNIHNKYRHNL